MLILEGSGTLLESLLASLWRSLGSTLLFLGGISGGVLGRLGRAVCARHFSRTICGNAKLDTVLWFVFGGSGALLASLWRDSEGLGGPNGSLLEGCWGSRGHSRTPWAPSRFQGPLRQIASPHFSAQWEPKGQRDPKMEPNSIKKQSRKRCEK